MKKRQTSKALAKLNVGPMSEKQIRKITLFLRKKLEERKEEFCFCGVESVNLKDFEDEFLEILKNRTESFDNRFVRSVNETALSNILTLTPEAAILSCGSVTEGICMDLLKTMPSGNINQNKIVFIPEPADRDAEKEYEKHKLIPINPYSLLALKDKPENCLTFWKGAEGKTVYLRFEKIGRKNYVDVRDYPGFHYCWLAGFRKT